jgi:hypothetical protein
MHSTPTTVATSQRGSITNSSTARFAHSIASRSSRSSSGKIKHASFDVPSLPVIHPTTLGQDSDEEDIESRSSVPDIYLPPEVDDEQHEAAPDYSLADALGSISREGSPLLPEITQDGKQKSFDYSVSLRSEPKVSLFFIVREPYCMLCSSLLLSRNIDTLPSDELILGQERRL